MVVHPSAGHYTGTLVNAIMYHCRDSLSGINGEIRPGIVHRIDMDTTGALVICKSDFAHQSLAEQLSVHSIGITGGNLAKRMVEIFLNTEFEGGRHARRVALLDAIQ